MNFLKLDNSKILIFGVANKKSLAYFAAKSLQEQGSQILLSVQNENLAKKLSKDFPETPIFICDVNSEKDIQNLCKELKSYGPLDGMLHSLAYARYQEGVPFHKTSWEDFQHALKTSCYSLVTLTSALEEFFTPQASIVTVSISNTKAASYGFMGPIKATLESTINYLAHSLSTKSQIRFNAVCAGPLKTSAAAGIPGYVDNYLFAQQLTLRKEGLKTQEVANTILFLLSKASSGIQASHLLVDAGMSTNTFDAKVVKSFVDHQTF